MDVTLILPDAKFQSGDIVKLPNRSNQFAIFIRIERRIAHGHFSIFGDKPQVEVENDTYHVTVQDGSVFDTADAKNNEIIRPGTFLVMERSRIDSQGEKVTWSKHVYSVDSRDNIMERMNKWDKSTYHWKEQLSAEAL
jgi:hypothetical protein